VSALWREVHQRGPALRILGCVHYRVLSLSGDRTRVETVIRVIVLLVFVWFGCARMLVLHADGLRLYDEKYQRKEAMNKAMVFATAIVAFFWWLFTLPPSISSEGWSQP
jgi:hypothetical protein